MKLSNKEKRCLKSINRSLFLERCLDLGLAIVLAVSIVYILIGVT